MRTDPRNGTGTGADTVRLLRAAAVVTALLVMGSARGRGAPPKRYDFLRRGGTVVEGTGAPRYRADVAVKGDTIVRVAREGMAAEDAPAPGSWRRRLAQDGALLGRLTRIVVETVLGFYAARAAQEGGLGAKSARSAWCSEPRPICG